MLLPAVTAPAVNSDTDVTLTLTVDDQSGTWTATATDTVVLTVKETSNHFVTTWATASDNDSITIPGNGTYAVLWGDGNTDENVDGSQTHAYADAGTYTVSITGDLKKINLGTTTRTNAQKLQSIEQWGYIGWTSMNGAFDSASNMVYNATDAPDLSRVTDMTVMFRGAAAFDGDLSGWDVSGVTDMNGMFDSASSFNRSLNGWNVSQVTDMNGMFFSASSFNQPLNDWDVSAVTDMEYMFSDATAFNQPLNDWDVSAVTDMKEMFTSAASFNQDLSRWDVSQVTDMRFMFTATSFNQPLSSWNVSQVTSMGNMFEKAAAFNQDISGWDVSQVASMNSMFRGAAAFDGDLSGWDVSAVIHMDNMFLGATSFNQPLSEWDVSQVTAMSSMFSGATSFDQNLGNWYVVPADTAYAISEGTLNVTTISAQNSVLDGHSPKYGIGLGDDSDLFNMTGSTLMFKDTPSVGSHAANVTASEGSVFENGNNWRELEIKVTGGAPPDDPPPDDSAFVTTWATGSSKSITIPGTGTYTVDWGDDTSPTSESDGASHTYVASGTYTVSITGNLTRINLGDSASDSANDAKLQSIEQWGDAEWTSMDGAFHGASVMTYNATDAPDLSRVTDMNSMFRDAAAFNGNVSSWDVSQVTGMNDMFWNAAAFNQPLSRWDVSRVTNMNSMFSGATSFNQSLSSWNVSQVTDMEGMFWEATAFNGNVSSWDVSKVTNMNSMFRDAAAFNGNVSSWDVSKVAGMTTMFTGATSFDQNLGKWYIVPADTTYATSEGNLNVTTISAQNGILDGHSPNYGIGLGGDSTSFNITDANTLMFEAAPSARDYTVNVTASGNAVFEDGNNWRMLGVKVTGSNQSPVADAGADQDVNEGATVALDGTGSSDPDSDSLTYSWESDGTPQITLNGQAPTFIAPQVGASGGTVTFTLTVSDGNGGTDTDTVVITVNDVVANQPPVADAGADQDVNEGATVALDGTGSSDPDSDSLTYSWESDGTPQITLNGQAPTFTAPPVGASGGTVTFTLTVSDGNGGTDTDTVVITVNDVVANQPPAADAGADQDVNEGATVALDGTGSSDPDSDSLTYSWESDGTPQITLNGQAPTFTAPPVGASGGTVTFTLTVSDGNGGTDTDTVVITVNDVAGPNQPPAADAGADQDVNEGATVALDGTGSSDPDSDSLTYSWESDGTPQITLNGQAPTFIAPQVGASGGTVTFTLTVSDGNGGTDTDTVVITVNDVVANQPPAADAGADQDVNEGATVALDGTGSSDPDSDSLTYSWESDGTPQITLNGQAPTFIAPQVGASGGTVTFTLTVSDGNGGTDTDTVVITVNDVAGPNQPPAANAGADQAVNEGATVALDGSGSSDPDSDSLTYSWESDGTPQITLNGQAPTFIAPQVGASGGTVTFTLTVSDGNGGTDTDTVVITVNDVTVRDADSAFVTTWKTNSPGQNITIPGSGTYTIDWGDGTVDEDVNSHQTHEYEDAGTHTVSITGGLTSIRLGDYQGSAQSLQSIEQWGSIEWNSMANSFQLASNMVYNATDEPDLSGVDAMTDMFGKASSFDGNLSGWDVSGVTDMKGMFTSASAFNGDISGWDVSSVTDMNHMFLLASAFNGDLSGWNVSSVTDMSFMFLGAFAFDQNLGNWYVVPADTAYSTLEGNLNVTTISAQNSVLDGHSPEYGIGSGGDSTSFNITDSNTLMFKAAPSAGDYTVNVTASGSSVFENGNNWRMLGVKVTGSNQPPTVTISGASSINEGASSGTLTGTATDVDGTISSYLWSVDDTSTITITSGNSATLQYTASQVASNTAVTFTLTVTDDDGATGSDTHAVTVTNVVANQPPTVTISGASSINEGASSGTLTGTATDVDGTISSYLWSVDDTSTITITSGNSATLRYTASQVASNTAVTFTLTVTDDDGDTGSDTYGVTVVDLAANQPPTVTGITGSTSINEGASGTLTGMASDADGSVSSYLWSVDDTSTITITSGNSATLQYTASQVASDTPVTFTLTVTDDDGATGSDTYDVTVTDVVANQPPTVTISGASSINEGASGTLTGTASDADGSVSSYLWSVDDTSTITITSGNSATLRYTALPVASDTAVTFTLTVTDDDGATGSDTHGVTVRDVPPPPGTFDATVTPPDSPTNQDPTFDVTFGSAIPAGQFTTGDVSTSPPGLDVSVSGSGASFSFTINDAPDGRITAYIPAGAVSDAGGDTNTASNRATVTVDKTNPQITSARVSGTDTITVSFSEGVQGTTGASDWSIDGAPGVAVDSATGLPGSSVTLGLSGDLPGDKPELTLDYSGSGIRDNVGNFLGTVDDIAVSYPSSGKSKGQSAPPVTDIGSVIKSYPQYVPEWVIQAAGAHDPGTPIPPIATNGTFAFPLEIDSEGYLLDGPASTVVPAQVAAGQTVTMSVTIYDPTPIAYFAVYLNLPNDEISHLDSDAQIIWNNGQTHIIDRSGLMQDAVITLSEDPDDPAIKTFTITVVLSEGMGQTNLVIRTWNAAGQLAEVRVFDAVAVTAPGVDPEPGAVDPEPGTVDPEPGVTDPEPTGMIDAVDPEPEPGSPTDQDTAVRDLLAIRMWSGFEPESITDAQLLESLGLDYPGADIPSWVMTELGPLAAKNLITIDEFRTALEYVLEAL